MKILFIHSFDYYEPLGIMSLSAVLKRAGHECELLDLKFEKRPELRIAAIAPDVLAYSVTTNNWRFYHAANLRFKKHCNALSVFGGPHCTFFPALIEEEGVDVLCRGEGEEAFTELANALRDGNDYTKIPNLWVRKGNQIFRNDLRSLIENLDELPFPDRTLINKYRHYRYRSRIRTITSRGCPYQCTYCFNHACRGLYAGLGTYIRRRSPANVIAELQELKAMYHPVNFEFHDDIFILNEAWTLEFLDLYQNSGIKIPFEINIRVEHINEALIRKLRDAGCYSVQFGIETGNPEYRKQRLKRNIENQTMIDVARQLRQSGIKINLFNLLCLPGETLAMGIETMKLNAACRPTYAMNSIYQPYPGTELAQYAVQQGYYKGDVSNFEKNYLYGKSTLDGKDIKYLVRLHYLFAWGVRFPFLTGLIKGLVKLPFNKLYQSWYFLLRSWYVIFVFKRLRIRELFITEKNS
jgi:radical SAM superfamily enzyme YgiQ (UPF0313 family)